MEIQEKILCSFCGKSLDEVEFLIKGPGVYICDECVAVCQMLVKWEREARERKPFKIKKEEQA